MDIIPSINCPGLSAVHHKLHVLESFLKPGDWIHIDVEDGQFTFAKTWGDPTEFANMRLPYKTEVHLMVRNPEKNTQDWLSAGANRLILHTEALDTAKFIKISEIAKRYHAEIMIATNPETHKAEYRPYFNAVHHFQVLSVHPGPAGQQFLPLTMDKVKYLKEKAPHAKIEVDGGIDVETGKIAKKAGADILVSANFVLSAKHPPLAYKKLKEL